MCGGGGGTSYSQRPLEPEEKELIKTQTDMYKQFQPAIGALTSAGTAQIGNVINPNYSGMYANAQQQLADNQKGFNQLATGQLPSAYAANKQNYYNQLYGAGLGSALSSAAGRGVINSSVMNKSIDGLQKNMLGQMSQDYTKDLATQQGLLQSQQQSIYQPFALGTTANQASFAPVSNYLGLASGQGSQGTSLLQAISGLHNDRTTAVVNQGKGLF